jgi:orotate phosphoribosyltransferase
MTETLAPTLPSLHPRLGDARVVIDMLSRREALRTGHFALLSGAHTSHFLMFSRLAKDDRDLDLLAEWLTPSVAAWRPTGVLAPSTAGVALGWTLARNLGVPLHLADIDSEGRATDVIGGSVSGQRLVLVNDVVTTGAGMIALAEAARRGGAEVAGGAWFATRHEVDVSALIAAPVAYVAELALDSWDPDDCPLCRGGDTFEAALDLN